MAKQKILLSYSRPHFDPDSKSSDRKLQGSSAHILAATLYQQLSTYGKVTYIDPSEHEKVAGQSFDLFVGQYRDFATIIKIAQIKTSILFAVNMHPSERNKLMRKFCGDNDMSISEANSGDLVDERQIKAAINASDHIIAVGNAAVYNSYIKNGVSPQKIKLINYSQGESIVSPLKNRAGQPKRYVYIATELGLRKGFDVMIDLVDMLNKTKKPYQLDLIGEVKNDHYKAKLKKLTANNNVSYHGWVDVASKNFDTILKSTDYLLFPSLEEGQAGTVLDAARRGIVPIITQESGVDIAPLGFLDAATGSDTNRQIIKTAQNLNSVEITKLRQQTLRAYKEYHETFKSQLNDSLDNVIKDNQSLPKLSVVLAIFNKEKTILDLVRRLDRAAKRYGNTEVHIIFDGCKDNTEQVVRKFYAGKNNYQVYYKVTPNIFEVKTNNIGLKASKGKYAVIIQDDNYVNDPNCFVEAVSFLEKNRKAVVLGGLAGVNFYPRGTKIAGKGSITSDANEVYWRQDSASDPGFANQFYEVDACMRGPLFLRKSFLEEHGYLDEAYAPLYNDDMDLCFRTRKYGYKVYACLMDVENRSETIANYSPARAKFWADTIKKNSDLFYSRWTPSATKDYSSINRIRLAALPQDILWKRRDQLSRAYHSVRGKLAHIVKKPLSGSKPW